MTLAKEKHVPTDATEQPSPRKGLTTMEKIMIGITGFYLLGVVIYGFVPEGPARGIAMALYTCAFAYYLFNPLGPKHKKHQSGQL